MYSTSTYPPLNFVETNHFKLTDCLPWPLVFIHPTPTSLYLHGVMSQNVSFSLKANDNGFINKVFQLSLNLAVFTAKQYNSCKRIVHANDLL